MQKEHIGLHDDSKMPSKTADFAPVPLRGELDKTYSLSLIVAHSPHCVQL